MMILKKIQFSTNLSKYLIITLLTSYKNNVLYYLFIHEINFVTMLSKKSKKFYLKLILQNL